MKILLVEDNPGDARLIQLMLEEIDPTNYTVSHAGGLDEALRLLSEDSFDIVLLDLGLPESLGLETFNRVHSQSQTVPIVVLSGFDDESFAAEAVSMGARGYLNKNKVDSDLLSHTIKDVTGK